MSGLAQLIIRIPYYRIDRRQTNRPNSGCESMEMGRCKCRKIGACRDAGCEGCGFDVIGNGYIWLKGKAIGGGRPPRPPFKLGARKTEIRIITVIRNGRGGSG